MGIDEEILAALRAAVANGQLATDPKQGRVWQLSLQRVLGGQVADHTSYGLRAYQFDCPLPIPDGTPWRSTLRVLLSNAGPFVTHTVVRSFGQVRWWAGAIQVSRIGFTSVDTEALEKLRAWYGANELTEVDPEVQAMLVPADIPLRRPRGGGELTLFGALFKAG
ncbi:MAG: hypothetical protein JWN15_2416 [Firmicutes bacterium]|nr:hypothetical protein [Bacillota bacterium]